MSELVLKGLEGPVARFVEAMLPKQFDQFLASRSDAKGAYLSSLEFKSKYLHYLNSVLTRTCTIKNSLFGPGQVLLNDIYVAPKFQDNNETRLHYNSNLFKSFPGITLVVGNACQGKSTLSKKLFFDLLCDNEVPLLFEFSRMGDHYNVKDFVKDFFGTPGDHTFSHVVETIRPVFIFDGLDEVPPRHLQATIQSLSALSTLVPFRPITITSRPFSAGRCPSDRTLEICPFEKYEIIQVLEKLDKYYRNVSAICDQINDNLFDKYPEVFSIPLFAQIYGISYETGFSSANTGGDLRSIFFNDVFETLLKRHDLSKDSRLERAYVTGLNELEFRRVHEWLSVSRGGHPTGALSRHELLLILEATCERLGIKGDPAHLLEDLVLSIGIVVRDGNVYEWLHRAFQEFFMAHFLVSCNSEVIVKKVMGTQLSGDSLVLQFLNELKPGYFEQIFALPALSSYLEFLDSLLADGGTSLAEDLCESATWTGDYLGAFPKPDRHREARPRGPIHPDRKWVLGGVMISSSIRRCRFDYTWKESVANLLAASNYAQQILFLVDRLRFPYDGPNHRVIRDLEVKLEKLIKGRKIEDSIGLYDAIRKEVLLGCTSRGFLHREMTRIKDVISDLRAMNQNEETETLSFIFENQNTQTMKEP